MKLLNADKLEKKKTIVINFSGHGMLDLKGYANYFSGEMPNSK